MNRFLCLLFILTLPIVAGSFKAIDKPANDDGNIEVTFNRTLNFADIVKIKLDLDEKGIMINYNELAFDQDGKLKSIDFHVDCKDGFSGSAYNHHLTNTSRFGFYRNYQKEATSPFGTGGL